MAREIIVAVNGDDNADGTVGSPLATLAKALELAQEADTISLRQGEYLGGVTVRKENITIQSFAGESAHISVPNNSGNDAHDWALRFGAEASRGTLRNIEVSGGNYYAVKLETQWEWDDTPLDNLAARDITIENCTLHDSGRDVIKVTPGCDSVKILNNEIFNSGKPGGVQNDANAEGIDVVNSDNLLIRGNYIHDTATSGLYFKGGSRNAVVEDNFIINTGLSSDDSPNSGAGIGVGYFTDSDFFDPDNTGFVETFDAIVRNNTIVNTKDAGIMIFASSNPHVYGNTLYNVAIQPWTAPGGIFIGGQQNEGVSVGTNSPTVTDNIVVLARDPNHAEGYTGSSALLMYRNGDNTPSEVTGQITIDRNIYYQLGNPQGALLFGGRDNLGDQFFQPISFAEWQALGLDQNGQYFLPAFDEDYHVIPGQAGIDIPPTEDFDGTPGGGGGGGGGDGGGGGQVGDIEPDGPEDPGGLPLGLVSLSYGPGTSLSDDSDLVMNFAAPVGFEFTDGTLRIVREDDGLIVGVVDFEDGQAGDGTTQVIVDLDAFALAAGTTYSVVADDEFLRINMDPWRVGAIDRGDFRFTTAGVNPPPPGGGNPGGGNPGGGNPGGGNSGGGVPPGTGTGNPSQPPVLDRVIVGTNGANTLVGGLGNDRVKGLKGNDKLFGMAGSDSLYGGFGDDRLYGASGNDLLRGEQGIDSLFGGAGSERFVFDRNPSKTNVDRIGDFRSVDDVLLLDNAVFKKIGRVGLLDKDAFHRGVAAADGEDRIIYNGATGALYYDPDGTGEASQVKFAVLTKKVPIVLSDFQII